MNFPNDYGISGVIKPDSILKKRDTVLFVVACFKPDITNYAVIHVRRIVENADIGKFGYGKLHSRNRTINTIRHQSNPKRPLCALHDSLILSLKRNVETGASNDFACRVITIQIDNAWIAIVVQKQKCS